MKKQALFILVFLISQVFVFSQDNSFNIVTTYRNEKTKGSLFFVFESEGEEATGNKIIFDENGNLIIHQFDLNLIYFMSKNFEKPEEVLFLSPPVYAGLGSAADRKLFFTFGGDITYMNYSGKMIFKLDPYQICNSLRFTSYFYHSNILFFLDSNYNLHSVLEPSMDEKQNMANYRDPEETKKLFSADSGVAMHGLTMDEKGMLFMNGKSFYLQNQYYGSYSYNILDQQNVYISDGKQKTRISTVTSENEIGESTAIHPSGDIYFLKYNKIKNTHILYRIENTWDSAFRNEWYKNVDIQIVK